MFRRSHKSERAMRKMIRVVQREEVTWSERKRDFDDISKEEVLEDAKETEIGKLIRFNGIIVQFL